jgi:hypothetical protein
MHFADILDYAEAQLARTRLYREKKAEQAREAEAVKNAVERDTDSRVAEIDEHFRNGL